MTAIRVGRAMSAVAAAAVATTVIIVANGTLPMPPVRAQGSAEQQPTFRASADAVRIDVSVRRNGRPVSGLRAGDFDVRDNGVAQTVTDVGFETGAIDVSVALDLSGSVSGATLQRLRRGIDQLRERLRPADRLKLVTFNMRVRRVVGFDDPPERAETALSTATAGGGTSLLDTIAVLLSSAAPIDRRQLIIVFSDGLDTSSLSEPDALLAVAARTTPTVAFVQPAADVMYRSGSMTASAGGVPQVGTPGVYSSPIVAVQRAAAQIPAIYRDLTAETGGQVLLTRGENLGGAFARLLDDFRSSYVLHYAPMGVSSSGFHTLEVKVAREGTFEVRARRGYVSK